MPLTGPTEMNRRHARFWAEQTHLRQVRMDDRGLVTAALEMLRDEEMRGVPVRWRLTLESCLERAEKSRSNLISTAHRGPSSEIAHVVLSEKGRKGGSAPRRLDPLQVLIQRLVVEKPDITEADLLKSLHGAHQARDTIDDIDSGVIHYEAAPGHLKAAPITGLKHRLSRAKKRHKSRKALRATRLA